MPGRMTDDKIDRVAKTAGEVAGGCAGPAITCGCWLLVILGGVVFLALCAKLFLAIVR